MTHDDSGTTCDFNSPDIQRAQRLRDKFAKTISRILADGNRLAERQTAEGWAFWIRLHLGTSKSFFRAFRPGSGAFDVDDFYPKGTGRRGGRFL